MRIGQSGATPWKALGLQTAIQGIIKNARCVLDRAPGYATFHCFDMFAGTGVNDYGDGSPVILANSISCDYRGIGKRKVNMVFVERSKRNFEQLVANTKNIEANKIRANCTKVLYEIPEIISGKYMENRKYAVGLIILDPNGLLNQEQWDALKYVSNECPRIDIILNWNISALHRCRGVSTIEDFKKFNHMRMTDFIRQMGKECQYVRNHSLADHTSWTILLLSNIPVCGIKEAGFNSIRTRDGKRTIQYCDGDKGFRNPIPLPLFKGMTCS
jgi:three-Cys-motif partner protein